MRDQSGEQNACEKITCGDERDGIELTWNHGEAAGNHFWLLRVMRQIYRKRLISMAAGAAWQKIKRLLVVSMISGCKQCWLFPAEIHTCKVLRIKS